MKYYTRILFFFLFILPAALTDAQPFAGEIEAFKKLDAEHSPPEHAILFVGSSSFRMWKDVNAYFEGYTIINRGFGGSSLPDLIRYENDIIFPYAPRQIVIYCGENDFGASDTVTAGLVFQRFRQLFTDIRQHLPAVPIVFVSIKPSPSRWQWKDRMIEANTLIRKFLKKKRRTSFVNVWNSMLGPDGKPDPSIFIGDNLHMNAKGYAIWKKQIQPHLLK
ncbi:MAG: G-D-S-L family lipolytic protein [Terrimonas sp.]|nr:G-D-S-L family lipolytic protein [Terrimonas sp.]